MHIPEGKAWYGDVNDPILYNLEGGAGPDRDSLEQVDPNSHMDSSIAMQDDGIGFQHKLINGEGLAGTLAEAVLQLPGSNLVTGGRQGQQGEREQGEFHGLVAA